MAEVLIAKKQFAEGSFELYVDQEKKLVRDVWIGKYNLDEFSQTLAVVMNEIKKFNKGEPLYLHNVLKSDIKLWTTEHAKAAKDFAIAGVPLCKRIAFISGSFMHQKSDKAAAGELVDAVKYFTTEAEGLKFLFG